MITEEIIPEVGDWFETWGSVDGKYLSFYTQADNRFVRVRFLIIDCKVSKSIGGGYNLNLNLDGSKFATAHWAVKNNASSTYFMNFNPIHYPGCKIIKASKEKCRFCYG